MCYIPMFPAHLALNPGDVAVQPQGGEVPLRLQQVERAEVAEQACRGKEEGRLAEVRERAERQDDEASVNLKALPNRAYGEGE